MGKLEENKIYKEAQELFILLDECLKDSVKTYNQSLYNQIFRSSRSIHTNIAEGYGKRINQKEFARFLKIAVGSTKETISHLIDIKKLYKELNQDQLSKIENRYRKLEYAIFYYLKAVLKNF